VKVHGVRPVVRTLKTTLPASRILPDVVRTLSPPQDYELNGRCQADAPSVAPLSQLPFLKIVRDKDGSRDGIDPLPAMREYQFNMCKSRLLHIILSRGNTALAVAYLIRDHQILVGPLSGTPVCSAALIIGDLTYSESVSINEVTLRRALGWVTVFAISLGKQPAPR